MRGAQPPVETGPVRTSARRAAPPVFGWVVVLATAIAGLAIVKLKLSEAEVFATEVAVIVGLAFAPAGTRAGGI